MSACYVYYGWKFYLKRFGCVKGDISKKTKNKLKYTLMINKVVFCRTQEKRALNYLKDFLGDLCSIQRFIGKNIFVYNGTRYIQRKVRDQLHTKGCKTAVLISYWDKVFGMVQARATELKDKATNELCRQICLIPPIIRYYVLRMYADKC